MEFTNRPTIKFGGGRRTRGRRLQIRPRIHTSSHRFTWTHTSSPPCPSSGYRGSPAADAVSPWSSAPTICCSDRESESERQRERDGSLPVVHARSEWSSGRLGGRVVVGSYAIPLPSRHGRPHPSPEPARTGAAESSGDAVTARPNAVRWWAGLGRKALVPLRPQRGFRPC